MVKRFIKKIPIFGLALVTANLAGYSFHIVVSRHYGPADYGFFSVLMAMVFTFAQPLESIAYMVAREVVEHEKTGGPSGLLEFIVVSGSVGLVLAVFFFLWAWNWLDKPAYVLAPSLGWGAASLVLYSLMFPLKGYALGLRREIGYAFNRFVELGVRLPAGIAAVLAGGGIDAMVLAGFAGVAGAIVHLGLMAKKATVGLAGRRKQRQLGRYFGKCMWGISIAIPIGLVLRLDMIVASKVLTPQMVGQYAIANLVGKGVLIYSLSLNPLIFPYLVKFRTGRQGLQFVATGIGLTASVFAAALLVFLFFGGSIIHSFFGPAYDYAAAMIPNYLLAIFPIALNYQVFHLKMALGDWKHSLFLWAGTVVYFGMIITSPEEVESYLLRIAITQLTMAVAGCLFVLSRGAEHLITDGETA
jgi:O-antigen/teichoic acid export membrane protein